MRSDLVVERFPSVVLATPDLLATVNDEESVELTTGFIRTARSANHAPLTPVSLPTRAAVRRPRPSPLFGEGELYGTSPSYTLRDTQMMPGAGNGSTLWSEEATDPGIALDDQLRFHLGPDDQETAEDSVTLELDEVWRAQVAAIDAAFEHEHPSDDLSIEDLQFDGPDERARSQLRQRVRAQTHQPAPIALCSPIGNAPNTPVGALPRVAPARVRAGVHARVHQAAASPTHALVPTVTSAQRLVHAAQGLMWFAAGALVCGTTAATTLLLVLAAVLVG